ncbi:hydroxymethylbilane synthase [Enterobacterales bacterium endosymbiont of Anomoneura mori]|uniref:hydroxymethylbilane synthase n=1 Tax=Enterobacterales bacterium endosymbiont of Anomoneura mori TaxID=3132096 RepID=UPI00399D2BA9
MSKIIKIATRNSHLALWQAELIKKKIINFYPNFKIKIIPIITKGDIIINKSLKKIGGKNLFGNELEKSLKNKKTDIAVHSMKDISNIFSKEFGLTIICDREDPRDILVSNKYNSLNNLPYGSIVGTSSLRRKCQLLIKRPDLKILNIRGNINTRIKKLNNNEYDAIILSIAGLKRLGYNNYLRSPLNIKDFIPAAGQGAIGVEYRLNDIKILNILKSLFNYKINSCILTERIFNNILNYGCHAPIGSYAKIIKKKIWLRIFISSSNGKNYINDEYFGNIKDFKIIGYKLAKKIINSNIYKFLKK